MLARAASLVNNMQAGAPDKVVYEAAASCLPVVVSNPVFDELLPPELLFERDDPAELAERIARSPRSPVRSRRRSAARCATASARATRSSTGPTASSSRDEAAR